MTSAELYQRALQTMPGGNTRTTLYIPPVPPYASSGEGYVVIDEDGHSTIDLHGNYTSLVHGHRHPAVVAAASAALDEGICFGLPTRHDVALAERLCARIAAVERVRFANSGTEAVLMAVRTARAFTGRSKVLRFAGSYHGMAEAVLPADSRGLPAGVAADLVTVPVADADALGDAIARHGGDLACVVIDLMPNRAGLEPVPQAFAELVRSETRRNGIVLIVDEVITLRLAPDGLHGLYRIAPDLVTMGKVIGGGFAIGAWGGSASVMGVLDPRVPGAIAHAGTFAANPVTMRAGLAAVDLLDAAATDRLNALGEDLRARVAALGYRVAGKGSLFRVLDREADDGWWRLYRAGLLIGRNGLCSLSTVMDASTLDEVERRFAAAR